MPKYNNPKDFIGKKSFNNFGSEIIITEYRKCDDIDIYFPEYNWTAKNRQYSDFKNGSIKCTYEPRIYNIGYKGEGKYSYITHEKIYKHWNHILERCYSKSVKTRTKNKTYDICTINSEWLNFQNFAAWYEENYYEIPGETMCLNKDLLIKNNKEYGPNTCCFLPNNINILFKKHSTNKTEDLPKGIMLRNDVKPNGKKYRATCNKFINGKSKRFNLGCHYTIEEAFNAIKEFKEMYLKEVANSYSQYIPDNIYNAIYNWEVEITD